jgi:hypothetical protein
MRAKVMDSVCTQHCQLSELAGVRAVDRIDSFWGVQPIPSPPLLSPPLPFVTGVREYNPQKTAKSYECVQYK